MELRLIRAAIKSRDSCNALNRLGVDEYLSEKCKLAFKAIEQYYNRDVDAVSVDTETLLNQLRTKYPNHIEDFEALLEGMPEDISDINLVHEVAGVKRQSIGFELASALMGNAQNIPELLDAYTDVSEEELSGTITTTSFVGVGLDELFGETAQQAVFAPKTLNQHLGGGLGPGDSVLIFGPPEVGKSAISINAACGYLIQGKRVLYIGNEDAPQRMLPRFLSRLTKMPKAQMIANSAQAMELARERGYNNLAFVHMSPGSFGEIVSEIDKFKPDVVFIDQLRHLSVGKTEGKVTQLEKAGLLARRLAAQKQVLVVSICQGAATSIGKVVLERDDVDSSKIGLPGAVDVMIGVGCDAAMEQQNLRVLSICKNKTGGGHTTVRVKLNPEISLVTGD